MTKKERKRFKELKQLLKEWKKNPRYLELKRMDALGEEMSFEEINELTNLYNEHTSLLNEQTRLIGKQTDTIIKISIPICVLEVILLIVVIIKCLI